MANDRRLLPTALPLLLLLPLVAAGAPQPEAADSVLEQGATLVKRLAAGERSEHWIEVEDAPAYAFRARLEGATLILRLDGKHVQTFTGSTAYDLALPPGLHNLSWTLHASRDGAIVELEPIGPAMIRAPQLLQAPYALTSCTLKPFSMILRGAAPLSQVNVTVGDGPADATVAMERRGAFTLARIDIAQATAPADGRWQAVRINATDVFGKVWALPVWWIWQRVSPNLALSHDGWVYDQSPAVTLTSTCDEGEILSVEASRDGEPVDLSSAAGAWTIPATHKWAYEETHTHSFRVTLADGAIHTRSGRLIEGLDEMHITLPDSSRVVALAANGVATLAIPPLFAEAAAAPIPDSSYLVEASGDTTMTAIHAPRALQCVANVCTPYGGNAPGFEYHALSAELVVSRENGETRIPGFGQLAAAAARTQIVDGLVPQDLSRT